MGLANLIAGPANDFGSDTCRAGYLIVPRQLIEPMRREKAVADYGHPWIDQILLADFINGGGFARHLRRIRNACGKAAGAYGPAHVQDCRALLLGYASLTCRATVCDLPSSPFAKQKGRKHRLPPLPRD